MIFSYSRNYFPPAPIAQVTFINGSTNQSTGLLPALLDTGADATLIPFHYLEDIRAPEMYRMSLRSQWGESRQVMLYLVNLQVGDVLLEDIEAVGDELSDEIILGRDVLNQLWVFLKGPQATLEINEDVTYG